MILRPIASGERIHKIALEGPGPPIPDGGGGFTESWIPLDPAVVWASIEPATVARQERLFAGAVSAAARVVLGFPYHPGVNTETRITYGASVFTVVGFEDPERQHVNTWVLCTEIVG